MKLVFLGMALYYTSSHIIIFEHPESLLITDIRKAIVALNIFLVLIGCMILPDPSMARPSPGFWRVIQSLAFTYLINISFLLFFSTENTKFILQEVIDPSLKAYITETDYAADCRIYTPENPVSQYFNITNSIDVYVVCHFIGWMVKMWIFRNFFFTLFVSVVFEILELTFRYWMANFNECWWDSIILDVLGCNLIGM